MGTSQTMQVETVSQPGAMSRSTVAVFAGGLLVVVGLFAFVGNPAAIPTPAAVDTEALTLAGFKVVTYYKCINPTCTDMWCNANCNHHPRYCPASFCRFTSVNVPVPAPAATPTPEPTPPPTEPPTAGKGTCPAGTILGTSWWTTSGTKSHGANALVCCPAECKQCAGNGCAKQSGGAKNCCAKKITPANKPCSSNDAPCVLTFDIPEVPTPAPHTHHSHHMAVDTEALTLAGFKVVTYYKCINPTCTDMWCNANCNHHPRYCPASFCRFTSVNVPVPAPAAVPTPEPTPPPTEPPTAGKGTCPAGTILGTSWWTTSGTKSHGANALVCCPAECKQCAGNGCAKQSGGAKNCCAKKITP